MERDYGTVAKDVLLAGHTSTRVAVQPETCIEQVTVTTLEKLLLVLYRTVEKGFTIFTRIVRRGDRYHVSTR